MKSVKVISILMIVLALATNCTIQNEPSSNNAEPIIFRKELQKRVLQDNEFAFELFKKTIEYSTLPNVLVSPLSVSITLGMTWNGAMGETKDEMETALNMTGLSEAEINEYYKILLTKLPGIDPSTQLNLANSIWYKLGYEVKPSFFKINSDFFNADVRELDFTQTWAVDTINNWCSRKTKHLIPEMLDEIPSNAIMYLINSVYFNGRWQKQFDKKNTVETTFTNYDNKLLTVNMMHLKDSFAYTTDNTAQYIDLAYGNKAFSMTVILPNTGKEISDILDILQIDSWNKTLDNLTYQEVDVYLPRFTSKNSFLLNIPLMNMGMVRAFDERADFTGIADDELMISRVLHTTFIEVVEEGTEAGAVTVVEIRKSLPQYPVFKVNKPFVYLIREKSTGVILFIGKIDTLDKF